MAKIMISLPQEFPRKVDRAAKAQGRSRSELIREALRALLDASPGGRRSWKEALAPLKALEHQWVGQWNSTDIVRYYRETRYGHSFSRPDWAPRGSTTPWTAWRRSPSSWPRLPLRF